MKIFLDYRDFNTPKQKSNCKYWNMVFNKQILKITELEIGDVLIQQTDKPDIIIEKKTMKDFATSCVSRHMQDQAIRNTQYQYRAIIIVGDWKQVLSNPHLKRFNRRLFLSNYASLVIRYKNPIFMVRNEKEYVEMVNTIIRIFNNQEPLEVPLVVDRTGNVQRDMLMCIPSIGEKKAEAIIKKFKNINNIVKCSVEDLCNVKGINEKLAKSIKKELKE